MVGKDHVSVLTPVEQQSIDTSHLMRLEFELLIDFNKEFWLSLCELFVRLAHSILCHFWDGNHLLDRLYTIPKGLTQIL